MVMVGLVMKAPGHLIDGLLKLLLGILLVDLNLIHILFFPLDNFNIMKNLIYILIFLPGLLFSQETKNMELVGVRNISIHASENSQTTFEVQEGHILKVISATFGDDTQQLISSTDHKYLKLNDDYVISRQFMFPITNEAELLDVNINFPLYLGEGSHTLEISPNPNNYSHFNFTATLYTLEFKLTTP